MKHLSFAHSIEGAPPDQWQTIEAHLCNVAALCRKFAEKFGSGEWGYIEGLWHDIGKYLDDFQRRLQGEKVSVEHSGVGACLAYEFWERNGLPVAFAIAGHHGGLPNLQKPETGLPLHLTERIEKIRLH
ncbi:MAG: CRISPR-associated endonuclease Cas3'' [Desulfobacterales bacterium]